MQASRTTGRNPWRGGAAFRRLERAASREEFAAALGSPEAREVAIEHIAVPTITSRAALRPGCSTWLYRPLAAPNGDRTRADPALNRLRKHFRPSMV